VKKVDNLKLKKTQQIMLEILINVDKICKEHNLTYWLDSGTLLGAIRHKGFIPWDDDLDIVMSLEDYNKFIKIAPKYLNKNYFLQNSKIEKRFPYDFTKIRSSEGIIIEKHEANKKVAYNQGIFIDILPVITISSFKLEKYLHNILILSVKLFSYKYLNMRYIREILIKVHDSLHKGWSKKNLKVVRSGRFPSNFLYIDKESIFPLKEVEFENMNFFAPANYDLYLKTLYGVNYMSLPPKSKRTTHADKILLKSEVDE